MGTLAGNGLRERKLGNNYFSHFNYYYLSSIKNMKDKNKSLVKKVRLNNFPIHSSLKFTGERSCRSAISIKLQSNFIQITLRHGCSLVNLLYIFRTPFPKNTSKGLLLTLSVVGQPSSTIGSCDANFLFATSFLFVSVFLNHVSGYTIAIIGIDQCVRIEYFMNFKVIWTTRVVLTSCIECLSALHLFFLVSNRFINN